MDIERVLGIVVAAVAVFGAVLSTLNFRAQRSHRLAGIKLKVSNGFPVYGPRLGDLQLQLDAINTGDRSVVISSFGFKLPDGDKRLYLIDPTFKSVQALPHELPPHRNCLVGEDMRIIASNLAREGYLGTVRLVGFCTDQEGNEFLGQPWDFNVNEWRAVG